MDERRVVARMLQAKARQAEIADILGRDRSTILRELRRNGGTDTQIPEANGYFASRQTTSHASVAPIANWHQDPQLCQSIIERINPGWSPQQIAGRLKRNAIRFRQCHETIYKFAYSPDGHAIKLWHHLPERRAGVSHAMHDAAKSVFPAALHSSSA